jgi:ribosomal protein S18 acetylase RimI-like enzyme
MNGESGPTLHNLCLPSHRDGKEDFWPARLITALASRAPAWTFRPLETRDEPFLATLFADGQRETFARMGIPVEVLGDTLFGTQLRGREASWRHAHPASSAIVTEACGRPVGYMRLDFSTPGESLGVDIAVLRAERRGALGRRMLEAWLAVCDAHALTARLHVMPDNPARLLYRRLGFRSPDPTAVPVPMLRPPRA